MKVGDLVRRKPLWDEWIKYNPWMYTAEAIEVGIIVKCSHKHKTMRLVCWPSIGNNWEEKKDLEKLDSGK